MNERFTTFAAATTALVLVIGLLSPPQEQPSALSLPTTEDSGNDGLKGMYSWLKLNAVAVTSWRRPFTQLNQTAAKHGNLLVLSLPSPRIISRAEWGALTRWLSQGNNLLLLGTAYLLPAWATGEDCFCEVKKLLSGFAWTITKNTEDQPGSAASSDDGSFNASVTALQNRIKSHLPEASALLPMSSHPLLDGVTRLDTQTMPNRLQQPWTLHSKHPDNLAVGLLRVAGQQQTVAAWQIRAESGQILLLQTPDLFSNSRLNRADNAQFLSNLTAFLLAPEGQVLFDDYHFGLSELYDPDRFFKDPRLHHTLLFLGAFWLLYVIGHSNRLAPVRPSAYKPSATDFIEVMAGFFARQLTSRVLATSLVRQLLADLIKHRHLPDETAVWHWLSQHSQVSAQQLQILHQAEAGQTRSVLILTNTIKDIRTKTL